MEIRFKSLVSQMKKQEVGVDTGGSFYRDIELVLSSLQSNMFKNQLNRDKICCGPQFERLHFIM